MNKYVLSVMTGLAVCLQVHASMTENRSLPATKGALENTGYVDIPDGRFKAALIALGVDKNKNKQIELSEAEAITSLTISGKGILSLSGIEKFKNLHTLNCSKNALATLDLRSNSKLTNLNCASNKLTSLLLPAPSALLYLACGYNQLTTLDLTGSKWLKNISYQYNQLSSLDVSKNTRLASLRGEYNPLYDLDVSANLQLSQLICDGNRLHKLQVQNNRKLELLRCKSNGLAELDLRANTLLKTLDCRYNTLLKICVSDSVLASVPTTWLKDEITLYSNCTQPPIDTAIVFEDPAFKSFFLSYYWNYDAGLTYDANGNGEIEQSEALLVTSLHISAYNLYHGNLSTNNLSDMKHFPNLEEFSIEEMPLTHLELPHNKKLKSFGATSNPHLVSIKLDSNKLLERIGIYSTVLKNLDLTPCPNLVSVYLDAPLVYVDLRHLAQLESLSLNAPLTNNPKAQICDRSYDWCNYVSSLVCIHPSRTSIQESWDAYPNIEFVACEPSPTRQGTALEEAKAAEIAIFPNPATEVVQVQSVSSILGIRLKNIEGTVLLSTEKASLDVSSLEKGMYLLEIQAESGTVQRKIAVQ